MSANAGPTPEELYKRYMDELATRVGPPLVMQSVMIYPVYKEQNILLTLDSLPAPNLDNFQFRFPYK